ncbi:MAG: TetR/AcrR family transcriptional regulator [Clostridiales bacterium]|nr:TetR/AcrR family transcriptional regulator [Clostridiales bacterium]
MNRSESKFHNTAVKFDKALLELLEIKDFTEISIKDICEKAGVNRSTFYLHYDNTYDLLQETQNYIMDNFLKSFGGKSMPKDLTAVPKEELNFISLEYLVPYLKFIEENKRVFKVYMQNLHNFDSNVTSEFFLNEVFVPILKKNGVTDKTAADYMMRYYLMGITAIVAEWVKRDCGDDILFLCEIINTCVRPL